jgi:hypothetical protein
MYSQDVISEEIPRAMFLISSGKISRPTKLIYSVYEQSEDWRIFPLSLGEGSFYVVWFLLSFLLPSSFLLPPSSFLFSPFYPSYPFSFLQSEDWRIFPLSLGRGASTWYVSPLHPPLPSFLSFLFSPSPSSPFSFLLSLSPSVY